MLKFLVNGQSLTVKAPLVAADTINYITCEATFSEEWDGLIKWAHFAKDGVVYDVRFDGDAIQGTAGINLTAGTWKVYLHGNEIVEEEVTERITTNERTIIVEATGALNGEPFPPVPPSIAEQILAVAEYAKGAAQSADNKSTLAVGTANDAKDIANSAQSKAQSVVDAAERGDFDGFSPVVTLEEGEHERTLTITSKAHPEGQSTVIKDGAGGTPSWSQITEKPDRFPPTAHEHTVNDVSGLAAAIQSLANSIAGKADRQHTHTLDGMTLGEVD